MISVGLDLHKKTAQIAAMDKDGTGGTVKNKRSGMPDLFLNLKIRS